MFCLTAPLTPSLLNVKHPFTLKQSREHEQQTEMLEWVRDLELKDSRSFRYCGLFNH